MRSPVDGFSTKNSLTPETSLHTIPVTGRFDLTDEQWAVLAPLLPVGRRAGRPPKWSRRRLIDGIRWRVRVGAPWHDVPPAYGPWESVYGLFRRWQRDGRWAALVTALQVAADDRGIRVHAPAAVRAAVEVNEPCGSAALYRGTPVSPPPA